MNLPITLHYEESTLLKIHESIIRQIEWRPVGLQSRMHRDVDREIRDYADLASPVAPMRVGPWMLTIDRVFDHDPPDSRNHMAKPYDDALIGHLRNHMAKE